MKLLNFQKSEIPHRVNVYNKTKLDTRDTELIEIDIGDNEIGFYSADIDQLFTSFSWLVGRSSMKATA